MDTLDLYKGSRWTESIYWRIVERTDAHAEEVARLEAKVDEWTLSFVPGK